MIGVDLSATHNKGCGTGVYWPGKICSGNLFDSSFLSNTENPPSNCRSYKYVAGKDIRTGNTESCDISKVKLQQFAMCKRKYDWCSQGQSDFSTTDHIQVGKGERQEGKQVRDAANDAKLQGIISKQGTFRKTPFPMRRTHGCLAECK